MFYNFKEMQKILLLLLIINSNYLISQEFLSKEEFKDSIPPLLYKNHISKIEKEWMSLMTQDDINSIRCTKNKLSKKLTIDWNNSQTDYTYYNNYYNGIELKVTNQSKKTIKYVKINLQAYNAVGDKVYDGFKTRTGIGPIEPYETGQWLFDNCWNYENTINEIKIVSMCIEYMDKSKFLINDVYDYYLDSEEFDKYFELLNIKDSMLDNYIDSIYNSKKQEYDNKIRKKLERDIFIKDSINKRLKFVKDSIDNISLNIEYIQLKNSLIVSKNALDSLINKLLILDDDKKYFILNVFKKNVNEDLKIFKDIINQITDVEKIFDTKNNDLLYQFIIVYKPYYQNINTILQDSFYVYKIDSNFLTKKLKKTNLFKETVE